MHIHIAMCGFVNVLCNEQQYIGFSNLRQSFYDRAVLYNFKCIIFLIIQVVNINQTGQSSSIFYHILYIHIAIFFGERAS